MKGDIRKFSWNRWSRCYSKNWAAAYDEVVKVGRGDKAKPGTSSVSMKRTIKKKKKKRDRQLERWQSLGLVVGQRAKGVRGGRGRNGKRGRPILLWQREIGVINPPFSSNRRGRKPFSGRQGTGARTRSREIKARGVPDLRRSGGK